MVNWLVQNSSMYTHLCLCTIRTNGSVLEKQIMSYYYYENSVDLTDPMKGSWGSMFHRINKSHFENHCQDRNRCAEVERAETLGGRHLLTKDK